MTSPFIAACIQNNATPDVNENIDIAGSMTREAAQSGAKLITLPEYFSGLHTENGRFMPAAYSEAEHPVLPAFAKIAQEENVTILLGSLGVTTSDGRINNRSYLLAPDGSIIARYNKIHMFDVNLGDGKEFKESDTIAPGDEAVVADTAVGALGLSICYDVRFGALYRTLAQQGAQMLATPAAFAKMTGQAHWHILQRARAIENGCFVLAACQYGSIVGGGECYGHSLIVAPWGEILAEGGEGQDIVMAEIDLAKVDEARRKVPSLSHDRAFTVETIAEAAE